MSPTRRRAPASPRPPVAAGRDDVRIVVLGAGAPQDTVDRWLVAAAGGGYDGFAVGRSIWADAVVAHDHGALDAAAARSQVAARYASFIDTFTAAAARA